MPVANERPEALITSLSPRQKKCRPGERSSRLTLLTSGRSGMILDLVIEAGYPADSDRLLPMLARQVDLYGQAPRQAAADGGFATRDNLAKAKAWGVSDMASTLRSASASRTWSKASGSIASCALPRRYLLPQARSRPGPLHLAWPRSFQDLRLVLGRGLQSRPLPSPQADLNRPGIAVSSARQSAGSRWHVLVRA